MEKILVLTHVDESGAALSKASLEAVTAGIELAARLSAPLAIGVLGVDAAAAARALAATGASLLIATAAEFSQARYASAAAAGEAAGRGAAGKFR